MRVANSLKERRFAIAVLFASALIALFGNHASPMALRLGKKTSFRSFCRVVALLVVAVHAAPAQEAADTGLRWRALTGLVEVAVADKYIYNGYVIQDQGPIVQPYFELAEEFYTGSGLLTSASVTFSFFSSFQSREDGATHTAAPGHWLYETEFDSGIKLELAKRFAVSVQYVRFESPIDAYQPSNAIRLTLTWDDKDLPGWFALQPYIAWLAPVPFGWNDGGGNYFEVGITPSTTVARESRYPITFTFPINAGFGDDTYYPGDPFGYVSISISASVPLAFLPKDCGEWKFGATGTYYHLGPAAADLSNDGDRSQSVFTATLSMEF